MHGTAKNRDRNDGDEYSGFSLVELLVAALLLMLLLGLAQPGFANMRSQAQRLSAATQLQRLIWQGRTRALHQGVMVGYHFDRLPEGVTRYQLFQDGNANGITAADRELGIDPSVTPPLPLFKDTGFKPELPPVTAPAIPPGRGALQASDAITLTGDTLSFSPLGSFNNGSIYLGNGREYLCLRLAGSLGRIKIFRWKPGQPAWQEVVQ